MTNFKKIFLLFFLILLTNCGYSPLLSTINDDFNINNLSFGGDRQINNYISSNLKKYQKRFRKLEREVMDMVKDPFRLNEFWEILDMNGNNKVSLAEIDKLVVYSYPQRNNKKALMRAYKQTCLKDGGDGDAWIEPNELPQLLINLFYFNS